MSTQGTRSASHRLVSELESLLSNPPALLKGSRGDSGGSGPWGLPVPAGVSCVSALIYLIWQMAWAGKSKGLVESLKMITPFPLKKTEKPK